MSSIQPSLRPSTDPVAAPASTPMPAVPDAEAPAGAPGAGAGRPTSGDFAAAALLANLLEATGLMDADAPAAASGAAAPAAASGPVVPAPDGFGGAKEGPPIAVGGKLLERLGPPPTPLSGAQQLAMNALVKAQTIRAPDGWRSEEKALEVARSAPVRGRDGKPVSLGELAIWRCGGGNLPPSPAYLFRLAQHAGRAVIAYQGSQDPAQNRLRKLTEYQGVPVPPGIELFAIGGEDAASIAPDQASDQLLACLEQMRAQKDELGVDPLTSRAVLLGNSEASIDGALTRERLEGAGFGDAIGAFVAVTSGLGQASAKAHTITLRMQGLAMTPMLRILGPENKDGKRFMEFLSSDRIRDHFDASRVRLVDLSVSGHIGGGAFAYGVFGGGNNIRPELRMQGAMNTLMNNVFERMGEMAEQPVEKSLEGWWTWATGATEDSDGLVGTAQGRYGRDFITSEKPHDHLGMIEDPAVMDEILARLDRTMALSPRSPRP